MLYFIQFLVALIVKVVVLLTRKSMKGDSSYFFNTLYISDRYLVFKKLHT